jgi:hypothetical protein
LVDIKPEGETHAQKLAKAAAKADEAAAAAAAASAEHRQLEEAEEARALARRRDVSGNSVQLKSERKAIVKEQPAAAEGVDLVSDDDGRGGGSGVGGSSVASGGGGGGSGDEDDSDDESGIEAEYAQRILTVKGHHTKAMVWDSNLTDGWAAKDTHDKLLELTPMVEEAEAIVEQLPDASLGNADVAGARVCADEMRALMRRLRAKVYAKAQIETKSALSEAEFRRDGALAAIGAHDAESGAEVAEKQATVIERAIVLLRSVVPPVAAHHIKAELAKHKLACMYAVEARAKATAEGMSTLQLHEALEASKRSSARGGPRIQVKAELVKLFVKLQERIASADFVEM